MAAKDDFPAGVARDALCAVCNEPADSQCSACKVVRFCSSDHAKEGWKKHKPTCKAMKRLNSSGRSWEKVITTEGTGEKVGTGKMAEVHYVGTLANGIKFDSSRDKGRTFKFPVGGGRVIRYGSVHFCVVPSCARRVLCICVPLTHVMRHATRSPRGIIRSLRCWHRLLLQWLGRGRRRHEGRRAVHAVSRSR